MPRGRPRGKAKKRDVESRTIDDDDNVQEVEMETPDPEEPASKKTRLHIRLSPEEEQDIVEFISANPCLYDKKLRDWLNKGIKDRLWQEQASKMGKSVSVIKTWYDSIHTRLGRLRRTKSGQGDEEFSERDRWIYEKFQFLCPHIVEVQRRTVVSLKSKIDEANPGTTDSMPLDNDNNTVDQPGSPCPPPGEDSTQPSSSVMIKSKSGSRTANTVADTELMTTLAASSERQDQLLTLTREIVQQMRPSTADADSERTNFSKWVASVLQQLPRDLYRSVQREIFTILGRARDEQDVRETHQRPTHQQNQGWQQPQQRMQQQQFWQPPPNQWPQQTQGPQVSVWGSQDPTWVQQQFPNQQSCDQQRLAQGPVSCPNPPITSTSTPRSGDRSDRSYFNLSSVLDKINDEDSEPLEQSASTVPSQDAQQRLQDDK